MDKVHFDYDIDMVDYIYIDNEMCMVVHNQLLKIDQMEQYLFYQLFLYQLLVVDEVMVYYDDNLYLNVK